MAMDAAERLTRLENRVDEVTTKADKLDGAYEHLATGEDVSKAQLSITKWLVGLAIPVWVGVGVQIVLSLTSGTGG